MATLIDTFPLTRSSPGSPRGPTSRSKPGRLPPTLGGLGGGVGGDNRLITAGLEALGELCQVMRQDILPYADILMPLIIANMNEGGTPKKQEMAVRTLGQLVNATGQVVHPYMKYPGLLSSALSLLQGDNNTRTQWNLRREVLRTLGLLGALEPHRYSMILLYLQKIKERSRDEQSREEDKEGAMLNEGWYTGGHGLGAVPLKGVEAPPPPGGGGTVFPYSTTEGGQLGRALGPATPDAFGGSASSLEPPHDKPRTGSHGGGSSSSGGSRNRAGSLASVSSLFTDDFADKPAHLCMYDQGVMKSIPEPLVVDPPRLTPSNEDYYPRIAVTALMGILRNATQSVHHSSVTQAMMLIFKSLGMQCVPFLDQIVPYVLDLVKRSNHGLRESLLQQLSQLASIVQYHLTPYLPAMFEIITTYWHDHTEPILALVEEVSATASDAFSHYVPVVLPLLLQSLTVPTNVTASTMRAWASGGLVPARVGAHPGADVYSTAQAYLRPLEKILSCHDALRNTLRPHMHLVLPEFCKLITQLQEIGPESESWQCSAIRVMRRICVGHRGAVVEQSNVMTTRVMHTLTKAVQVAHDQGIKSDSPLYKECITTLCRVGRQLGSRLSVFDNLILKSIEGKGLHTQPYRELSLQLNTGNLLDFTFADREDLTGTELSTTESESDLVGITNHSSGNLNHSNRPSFSVSMSQNKISSNQSQLARSWDVSQRSTAVDWKEVSNTYCSLSLLYVYDAVLTSLLSLSLYYYHISLLHLCFTSVVKAPQSRAP